MDPFEAKNMYFHLTYLGNHYYNFLLFRRSTLYRYSFLGKFGDNVKGRSQKKLKILVEVPKVCQVKAQVFIFNMILLSSPLLVPGRSYPYRRNFGRSGIGSFSEKAKIIDRGSICSAPESTGSKLQYEPYSSPKRVPRPSYPFREIFGRSGKGSFAEKAKIVDRGSLCSALESTGSKLQYEPYLFSVVSS